MSDKKISEMTEATMDELPNVQAIGVKTTVDGSTEVSTACRYNIGAVTGMVEQAVKGVVTPDATDVFSESANYSVGQFCTYNSKFYRFIKTHWAGPWRGNSNASEVDVVETDFWKEISSVTSTDTETVTCTIAFYNADGSRYTGTDIVLQGHNVSLIIGSGESSETSTEQTDANGSCVFTVPKGTRYRISVESVNGFATPISREFVAQLSQHIDRTQTTERIYGGRSVNFEYRPGSSENATVTAHINVLNGTGSGYNGKTATLVWKYGSTKGEQKSSTITYDSSTGETTVVFTDVPQGYMAQLVIPPVGNYVLPEDKFFMVVGTDIDINVDVVTSDLSGLYYVVGETETSIADGTAWGEYLIENFPFEDGPGGNVYDETKHPCIALHAATAALIQNNADYYVRIKDLTTNRPSAIKATTKQWCTVNQNHPHVTTLTTGSSAAAYDGPTMTGYMQIDSMMETMHTNSPAALHAPTFKFEYRGKEYSGYIGTRVQMDEIFKDAAYVAVYAALSKFGLTGDYHNGTYWWSSTQYNATYAWYWNSSGNWNYNNKNYNYYTYVLPFFAIH